MSAVKEIHVILKIFITNGLWNVAKLNKKIAFIVGENFILISLPALASFLIQVTYCSVKLGYLKQY